MKKSVTVVIPAYNAEATLEKAVQSVLDQTVQLESIIIVNDGSKDNTQKIAEDLKSKAALSGDAPVINVISIENSGASHARNVGIKAANTEYIAFLDSDDSWQQEKIEKQLQVFEAYKDAALVSTSSTVKCKFTGKTKLIAYWHLLIRNHVITSSAMSKASILQSLLFDETLKRAEDYNLWLKIGKQGSLYFIDEKLVFFADKRTFGQTGLSKDYHALSQDELRGFIKLYKTHYLNIFQFVFGFSMSCIKYARKCILMTIYKYN